MSADTPPAEPLQSLHAPRRVGSRRGRRTLIRLPIVGILGLVLVLVFATPSSAATSIAWPVQSLGDRGTDVLALQHLLRADLVGAPASTPRPPLDGIFRASTDAAVRAFQGRHGLAPTGIVNWAMWGKLIRRIGRGGSGEAVAALQVELVAKRRASLPVSGRFGLATEQAVIAFQRHMGLARTGVVDTATWRALVWHYETPQITTTSLCDYSVGNGPANWGTAEAIATLQVVGRTIVSLGFGRIAVGDISLEHGGPIRGHETHRVGLDVDVRPLRLANNQCSIAGTTWRSSAYDRAATRAMIQRFRASAPGHIKLIYFNDPILIREGLTIYHAGHDDHVHVRFCEVQHALAAYTC